MVGPRFVYFLQVGHLYQAPFVSCFYRVIHELGALCCNVAFFACLIRLLSADMVESEFAHLAADPH